MELHLTTYFEINFLIHVEIQLGQTIYASQGFKIQGTQFWTQNSTNPLPFGPNKKLPNT